MWEHVQHFGLTPLATEREAVLAQKSSEAILVRGNFQFRGPLHGGEEEDDVQQQPPQNVDILGDTQAKLLSAKPFPNISHAAPATTSSSDASPKVTAWIMDSGSPSDLVDRDDVLECADHIENGERVRLATANGETVSTEVLPLNLGRLGELILPHVLDDTPNVLSLGRRVVVQGYAFHWPAWSYAPWLVHPATGERIVLEVRDFVPYLQVPHGDATAGRDPVFAAAAGTLMREIVEDPEESADNTDDVGFVKARLKNLFEELETRTAAAGPRTAAEPIRRYMPIDHRAPVANLTSRQCNRYVLTVDDLAPEVAESGNLQNLANLVVDEHTRSRASGGGSPPGPSEAGPDLVGPEPVPSDDQPDDGQDDDPAEWLCEPCDGSDTPEEVEKVRRNLRQEATSLMHLRTHTPKNPYCSTCTRAKITRRIAKRTIHRAQPRK